MNERETVMCSLCGINPALRVAVYQFWTVDSIRAYLYSPRCEACCAFDKIGHVRHDTLITMDEYGIYKVMGA